MHINDLTEDHILEIFKIYEQHCGRNREFTRTFCSTPELVLQDIKDEHYMDYRIGSMWDLNSKICFKVRDNNIIVYFDSNFDPKFRKGEKYEAAEKAGEEFEKAAMQYLNSL